MQIDNLSVLKIHKFKNKEQYERAYANGEINENEICLTPDDEYSWDNLTDKPFGYELDNSITWDGTYNNSNGHSRLPFEINYGQTGAIHVDSSIFTNPEALIGTEIQYYNSNKESKTCTITEDMFMNGLEFEYTANIKDGYLFWITENLCVLMLIESVDKNYPNGIYFGYNNVNINGENVLEYVYSLKFNKKEFATIKTEYLPEHLQFGEFVTTENVEILSRTFSFNEFSVIGDYISGDFPNIIDGKLVYGQKYSVELDGVLYDNLTCWRSSYNQTIGRMPNYFMEEEMDPVPFSIYGSNSSLTIQMKDTTSTSHTIKITTTEVVSEETKTIDSKYLPDQLAECFEEGAARVDIIPETTVTVDNNDLYVALPSIEGLLEKDVVYSVMLNGVEYECTAIDDDSCVILGNGKMYGPAFDGNNEPFYCDSYPNGNIYLNTTATGTYTIRISIAGKPKKLKAKCLPEHSHKEIDEVRDIIDDVKALKAGSIVCAASGESIVVKDSANERLDGMSLYGKSTQFSTTGAQLFDIYNKKSWDDARFSVDDEGWISLNFNNSANDFSNYPMFLTKSCDLLVENTQYSLVVEIDTISNCQLIATDHTVDGNKGQFATYTNISAVGTSIRKITTRDSFDGCTSMLRSYFHVPAGVQASAKVRISVIENTSVTADTFVYEPYTGGIASPNPDYPQPIESVGDDGDIEHGVYGKNLFNKFGSVTKNNANVVVDGESITVTSVSTGRPTYARFPLSYPLNTPITVSFDATILSGASIIDVGTGSRVYLRKDSLTIDSVVIKSSNKHYSVAIPNGLPDVGYEIWLYAYISASSATEIVSIKYENIQVELGTKETEYEPYVESQTLIVSIPNGLPGIRVKKASFATYTDSNGKMWCADEIDFARGKYVQRVKKAIPTLSGGNKHPNGNCYVIATFADKVYSIVGSMCSMAINGRDTDFMYSDGYYYENSANFVINGTADDTLQTMREKLNGMEMCYILATPIERDLTAEELAAYKSLHSNYPTTTVMNDCNAFTEVSYNADTKTYIDNKFEELATVLVSMVGT